MKTQIRRLDSLTHNDTAATKLINDNFLALQQGIEDALSRSGKAPNFMDAELDMNMRRIINIGDPIDDYDIANKHYVDITVAAEEVRAKAAEKAITDTLATYGNIVTHNVSEFATASQGAKADTALQPANLGNATLTIKQGGTTKGTFTANASSDVEVNLESGVAWGGITGTLTDQTDLKNVLDGKQATITGGASSIVTNNITAYRALASDSSGKVSATNVTAQELNRLSGVTSSVQNQIDSKQAVIDSSHKLSADLVDDTSTTNKFVTASDKTTWSGKQDALVSGTNIKTINNTSILGSGNISISGGSDIVYKDYTISWTADAGYIDIDVSNEVESSILYVPMARVYSSNMQYIDTKIRYDKSSKMVRVYRNKNYYPDASNNDIAYITLIPTTSTGIQAWGVASGLASSQLVSNLVTSVDSSSTNSQYPSAKLFYDTCGDIETLINAL